MGSRRQFPNRSGAMLILLAIMMFAFLVTVAFSVDIAYMHLVRGELRTATDAASKAAAGALTRNGDRNEAIAAGQRIALANQVAGSGLKLRPQDFVFGHSTQQQNGRYQFQLNQTPFNSVQVVGARTTGSASGPVPLHFGTIFGINQFQPTNTAISTFLERDIVLVLDRSGSMSGIKIQDLKSSVNLFINLLQSNTVEEFVGLATYSTSATEDVQLTKDLVRISNASNQMIASGFTSISGGIDAGSRVILRGRSPEFVERTMIVMTDGIHNTGIDPEVSARAIASKGVVLHTITFGSDADQDRMRRIAQIGSGRFFHANDGAQLRQVFIEIAATLSTIMTK